MSRMQELDNRPEIEKCFRMTETTDEERKQGKVPEIVGINAQKFADLFLAKYPTVCILESKEILTYFNGRYVPNGAELIHKSLVTALAPYQKLGGVAAYSSYLYREVLDIIRATTYRSAAAIDNDLDIINVENGLLNWRTLQLKPHTPHYYSRIQHPVKYDPKAKCPSIEKVFKTVLEQEDYTKALEFIAYCLYRAYPIQKAFILYGPGGTGKTQFIEILCKLIGSDNVSSTSMHDLEEDRFATSELYNKCLNQFGDMEQTALPNVNILKMLTSGSDRVRAQRKREQPFDFVNFAKFIFGTNKLPIVKDDTTGFYRRIELLPFMHVFTEEEKDMELLRTAKSDEELSGLLNLVIPHLELLLERGEFSNSCDTKEIKTKYKSTSDPIGAFIEDHIVEVAGIFTSKEDVYDAYCDFCMKYRLDPLPNNWFGRTFAKKLAHRKDGNRTINGKLKRCWEDLQLVL
jgi:putative DNA primase/helicase